MTSLLTFVFLYSFGPPLAYVALGFLLAAGIGVPLLVRRLTHGLGRRQLELRGELNDRIWAASRGRRTCSSSAGSEITNAPSPR
jgi:ABC-type transport system involved in cytochrome bd biosynthesis fused ATPase/permease subunit